MITSAQEFVDLRTSSHREEYLRAARDTAPLEVWIEVTQRFPDMKVWVVRNKTVPIEILQLLSTDPDPSVRAAVASKNCLPLKLMAQLAEDGDVTVRQGIAYNKNTDREILRKLSSDPSDLVSSPARERFGMWPRP